MSNSVETGFVALHTNMFFTCSSGLAPAKISSPQNVAKTKAGHFYLVSTGTATTSLGDFSCRWAIVLAAAVAAAGVVTGGAALAVLAVASVGVSMTMCGGLMAPMRKWVGYSTLNEYGTRGNFSLTSKCMMVCPIGGTVTYAPGITSTWQAIVYTARNTAWVAVEGMILGKFASLGGSAFCGTATATTKTALVNFIFLQVSARGIGVADQVFIEGMLRNGKEIGETSEEAIAGATMFEQPFIQIWNKARGANEQALAWQDFYYAGLSILGMKAMANSATTNPNIPAGMIRHANQKFNAVVKGKLFERVTLENRFGLQSIYDNPVWRALWEQAKENLRKSETRAGEHLRNYENGNRGKINPDNKKSPSFERKAFDAVRNEFKKLAEKQGIEVSEGPIHHHNWKIEQFSDNATNPKNLYPTENRTQHAEIHKEHSSGHSTRDPINPAHEKPLYENKPTPIDENDLD